MNEKTRRDASDSGPAWVSRRAVTAGAAWSLPAVVLASSAASAATTGVTFSAPQSTTNTDLPGRTATVLQSLLITLQGSVPFQANVVASAPGSGFSIAATPTLTAAGTTSVAFGYSLNSDPKPAKGTTWPLTVTVTPADGGTGPSTFTDSIVFAA